MIPGSEIYSDYKEDPDEFLTRTRITVSLVLIIFLILIGRLFYLQILKGEYYRHLSENNRIRVYRIQAPRGLIKDREGRIIASNRPSFDLVFMPSEIRNPRAAAKILSPVINMKEEEIESIIEEAKEEASFRITRLKRDITMNEVSFVESNRLDLPGFFIVSQTVRNYPYLTVLSHLTGYISEITKKELQSEEYSGYKMGDFIGKYGIERIWDKTLRGIDGGRQVEVDAFGREISPIKEVEPIPGHDLKTTVDLDLQIVAEEAMQGKNGAVIAMDPRNGEILVMLSHPAFDPNEFIAGISREKWLNIIENPDKPLMNRCIQGIYPPGSTFKLVTAIAGLEEGVIMPDTILYCPGYYPFGNRNFKCWKEKGHGSVNLHRAIVESCDVYFYQVGLRTGVDTLSHYARMLGLGVQTGIGLLNEKDGIIPSSSWKRLVLGEDWFEGETLSVAIGQGYTSITPIQLLTLVSAIANGGKVYMPIIVSEIVSREGFLLQKYLPTIVRELDINPSTLEIIRDAMYGVVNQPHGTGWSARLPDVEVGGKTGTAQVISYDSRRNGGTKLDDHAWFISFAPVKGPELAIVVLVEHGGHGATAAAPIARKILSAYFEKKKRAQNDKSKGS